MDHRCGSLFEVEFLKKFSQRMIDKYGVFYLCDFKDFFSYEKMSFKDINKGWITIDDWKTELDEKDFKYPYVVHMPEPKYIER